MVAYGGSSRWGQNGNAKWKNGWNISDLNEDGKVAGEADVGTIISHRRGGRWLVIGPN